MRVKLQLHEWNAYRKLGRIPGNEAEPSTSSTVGTPTSGLMLRGSWRIHLRWHFE